MGRVKKITWLIVFAVIIIALKLFMSYIFVPPILMYHSLDGKEYQTKLSLCPAGFSKQMEFLHKFKYNVISLEEMVTLIRDKKRIPHKTVAITFDDGYDNNYLCAYPVLKKYGFPATIFVITDFIGKEGFLTWDQIRQMQDNNITIGSHTKNHLWLPDQDDLILHEQVFGSKEALEKNTGGDIKFISYPIGAHDERVKNVVREAGYMAACATNPGPTKPWDDIYALKRLRISRTSKNLLVFLIEISGYYTFIKEIRDEE